MSILILSSSSSSLIVFIFVFISAWCIWADGYTCVKGWREDRRPELRAGCRVEGCEGAERCREACARCPWFSLFFDSVLITDVSAGKGVLCFPTGGAFAGAEKALGGIAQG